MSASVSDDKHWVPVCGTGKIKSSKIECWIYALNGIWIAAIFFHIKEFLFCCKEAPSMTFFFHFKTSCKVALHRHFYNCIKISGTFSSTSLVFSKVAAIDVVNLSSVSWYIWWGFKTKRSSFLTATTFFGCIYKKFFFISAIVLGFCLMKGLSFIEFPCRKIYRTGTFPSWK